MVVGGVGAIGRGGSLGIGAGAVGALVGAGVGSISGSIAGGAVGAATGSATRGVLGGYKASAIGKGILRGGVFGLLGSLASEGTAYLLQKTKSSDCECDK